ncbi:YhcN/YlaJ family sporulation lipoprotein [Evansella sp. AB-P1]|uniref:YhcN/YlaJ family sporulation lipoprotein n=1 Tax=Evansella sp. AB-P1 TaxID=3037653 RepID=UPI00241BF96B|nr:YhcN/YlaJ family sporulation lipoprotein [Evansella sp. AB-P1]MDG5788907.1 YhcN/YlaJ family sporulation lipoprotein [Evansella sp. AB-P1]
MIRKITLLTMCSFSLLFTACGQNDTATGPRGQQLELFNDYKQPEQHFVINRTPSQEDYDEFNRFGFGRHTTETAYSGQAVPDYGVFDRSLLAQTISKTAASLNDIKEVAVLVTDQEVLMVYETENEDRNFVATQVKKTAYSTVPAYFEVYVSDNPNLMLDIKNFEGLSQKEPSYRKALDVMIQEMKSYPQGGVINFDDPLLQGRKGSYNENQHRSENNDH